MNPGQKGTFLEESIALCCWEAKIGIKLPMDYFQLVGVFLLVFCWRGDERSQAALVWGICGRKGSEKLI